MARILVIEDNAINLELMTYLLQAWGHHTWSAVNGDDGLSLARAERPDLVLCDLQMPGLDGWAVARALRADPSTAHTPLVAVTALAHASDRGQALAAGFDEVFCKPIDPARFMSDLQTCLPGSSGAPAPALAARQGGGSGSIALHLCAPRQPCLLLSVDDGPVNLVYKRALLEPAGYTVLTTDSVPGALALLRQQPDVDLVLSDVVMADGGGFELLRRLRSEAAWRDLPFVFLTSSARDAATRERAMAQGAQDFLVRPLDALDLLGALRHALRAPAARICPAAGRPGGADR